MRWFRWMHLGVVVAAVGVVGVLSLSDSIVGPLGDVLATVKRIGSYLASSSSLESPDRSSLPFAADTVLHFGGWAAVGLVAGGLMAQFIDRINLLLGLLALSAFFEAGQRYLTVSRSAELSDLIANGTGLVLGFTVFAIAERTLFAMFPTLETKADAVIRQRLRFG